MHPFIQFTLSKTIDFGKWYFSNIKKSLSDNFRVSTMLIVRWQAFFTNVSFFIIVETAVMTRSQASHFINKYEWHKKITWWIFSKRNLIQKALKMKNFNNQSLFPTLCRKIKKNLSIILNQIIFTFEKRKSFKRNI